MTHNNANEPVTLLTSSTLPIMPKTVDDPGATWRQKTIHWITSEIIKQESKPITWEVLGITSQSNWAQFQCMMMFVIQKSMNNSICELQILAVKIYKSQTLFCVHFWIHANEHLSICSLSRSPRFVPHRRHSPPPYHHSQYLTTALVTITAVILPFLSLYSSRLLI